MAPARGRSAPRAGGLARAWLLLAGLAAAEAGSDGLEYERGSGIEGWDDDAPVEVYYAEFLLAQWLLQRSPWNAYHSGLAFLNNRTGAKAMFDFSPEDASSVMNMIMPGVKMNSSIRGLFGDFAMHWRAQAKTQTFSYWPTNYNHFVKMGDLTGAIAKHFAGWVKASYTPMWNDFQPIEIVVPGRGTVVRSRLCHDFVTDALWVLYDAGVNMSTVDPIFRDHIIIYVKDAAPVDFGSSSWKGKREWLRYFRALNIYLEEIKEEFTHARIALTTIWKLGLPVFLHTEYLDHRMPLLPPFLNYCYLPVAIPPNKHDPFGSLKLCALSMEASLANITAPWPWAHVIGMEHRFDRAEAWLALAMVVVMAVFRAQPKALPS